MNDNVNPQDDLTPDHEDQFVAILIRRDGITDEMPIEIFQSLLAANPQVDFSDPNIINEIITGLQNDPDIVPVEDLSGNTIFYGIPA